MKRRVFGTSDPLSPIRYIRAIRGSKTKPGLDEKTYENALLIDFWNRGHEVEQQRGHGVVLAEL